MFTNVSKTCLDTTKLNILIIHGINFLERILNTKTSLNVI